MVQKLSTYRRGNTTITGITTYNNIVINSGESTGTADQNLQVIGGSYISGNTGIGSDVPQAKLDVDGNTRIVGILTVGSASSTTTTTIDGSQDFPTIRPTLDLNFAATKTLDRRITFTRDSIGTYTDKLGIIQTVPNNVPRFDHDPETGESLGLLIEESRTNLVTYSEDFTQWLNTNTTDTVDTLVTAPDGTNTATKITDDSTDAAHNVKLDLNTDSSDTFTLSCFVKKGDFSNFIIILRLIVDSVSSYGKFYLDNLSNNTTYGGGTNRSQTVTEYPNGWYRISFTTTFSAASVNAYPHIHLVNGDGDINYSGSGNYNYIWGAQLEVGSFPTSYIPTSGSTVTRAADLAKITGTNFTDFYNQSEGTVYVSQKLIAVQNTDRNNAVYLINGGSGNDIFYNVKEGDANIFVFGDGGTNYSRWQENGDSTDTKTIWAYDVSGDDFKPYWNGIEGVNESTTNTPSATSHTQLEIGATIGAKYNGHISKLSYYPRRLSNSQLQNLTK